MGLGHRLLVEQRVWKLPFLDSCCFARWVTIQFGPLLAISAIWLYSRSKICITSGSLRDVQLLGPIFLLNRKLGSDRGMLHCPVLGQIEYGLWLITRSRNMDLSLLACRRLLFMSSWWNL